MYIPKFTVLLPHQRKYSQFPAWILGKNGTSKDGTGNNGTDNEGTNGKVGKSGTLVLNFP